MSSRPEAAVAAEAGVARSRPRILPALARREAGAATVLPLILAAASAAAAAYEVHGTGGGALPLLDRLLRRFDMTVLAGSVMLLVFRGAAVIQTDHREGWLPAYLAAGGSRAGYGVGLLLSGLIGPAAIFAAAALTFAATVAAVSGSAELLRSLPGTTGGGLLVLGTWSACMVAVGVTVRRASATTGILAALVAIPTFLLLRHAFTEGAAPLWALMVQLLSPLLFPPADAVNTVRAFIYIGAAGGLTAILSHRYAGRNP